jgi:ketosteroid isomerase-like protein
MSEENVELLRGVIDHLDALVEVFDEDIVWDVRRHAPLDLEGVYHGPEAVASLFRSWAGAWKEYRFEVEEIIDVGDSVVVAVSETGRGIGSGAPWEQHYCTVYTFKNRRIVRGGTYKTKADALEAAVLSE